MKITLVIFLAYLCSFAIEQDKPEVAFISFVLAALFAIWSVLEINNKP